LSLHKSLKPRRKKVRSVLKRHERLAKAIRERNWLKKMGAYGLPKFNPPKFKVKKKEEEEQTTTLGKIDIIQEHLAKKESKKKTSKTKKKETTGRK